MATKAFKKIQSDTIFKHHMLNMVKTSESLIKIQGDGCYNEMGAAYMTKGKRDCIAILLPDHHVFFHKYETINSFSMKPVFNKLVKKYLPEEMHQNGEYRTRMLNILVMLQNAHDICFDPFHDVAHTKEERVSNFQYLCANICQFIEK